MRILEEILKGEGKNLEFKEKFPEKIKVVKTVIAFSNTSGGKLVIGINDKREVVGVEEDIFELQDKIASLIYESCHPNILPEIYTENIEGKNVLVVKVNRGNQPPYFIKANGRDKGTIVRLGATNRIAGEEIIFDLERQKRNISFDEEINYDYSLKDLDLSILEIKFEERGKKLTEEKLISLRLIKKVEENTYPTNGLLILLGKFENIVTKCSRFKGNTMKIFIDKKEYSGDLFSQLEKVEGFIKNHLHLRGEIKGLQRVDTYELPMIGIREAIVNAFVHRDYVNLGRDIKVGIYDNRLEIISPGGLPNGLTNEDILMGRSEIRNRAIARIFKELNFIEQWGSGINRIKESCKDLGLEEPIIEEKNNFVGVRFFRNESTGKVSKTAGKKLETAEKIESGGETAEKIESGGRVAEKSQEEAILELIFEKNSINRAQTEKLLDVKESRAKEILGEMVKKNLIIKEGKGRSTHYKLKSEVE